MKTSTKKTVKVGGSNVVPVPNFDPLRFSVLPVGALLALAHVYWGGEEKQRQLWFFDKFSFSCES